jgi:hypothetical protein
MPCTVKDDKSAIAQTSGVELRRHRARFEKLAGFTANRNQQQASTPKLVISNWTGGLAVLLLAFLTVRADAGFINLNCADTTNTKNRDALRFLDLDGFVNSLYYGSPKQFTTGRHGRYTHRKTGDYLDREWYQYLDEGQYYYLDRTQYKLLGGASYVLGHPCYPKLYEKSLGLGCGNRRGGCTYWYDCSWDYLTVGEPASLGNVCTGYNGIPIDNYVVWHSCLKPGDNIEKSRYRYLDKWRYYILDNTQYKWLGGLAYKFETFHYQDWYLYDSQYYYNCQCLLKHLNKESISTTPEPATVAFMGLGALGVLILRNKKRSA